jgi:light-regulated signal transduction histidine kinase (bacteriophytochrome)
MDDDHLIHIFTDVTSIKESQLNLERTILQLKRSNANLEEFAYAASHDMKEPIRKIHIFSDILKTEMEQSLTENQARLFDRMQHAVGRMTTLIDDLLAYSHATKGVPDLQEIDLENLVLIVLEVLDLEIQEKGARVSYGALPVIQGNKRQLQQLFQNLISNALKYAKPGVPPEVSITAEVVLGKDVTAQLPADEATKEFHLIQVRDNGIGFNQADADRIFNVFTRLHGNTDYKGSGVGLSIVRKVTENLDGHAWAESTPGGGATFNILIPVNHVPQQLHEELKAST